MVSNNKPSWKGFGLAWYRFIALMMQNDKMKDSASGDYLFMRDTGLLQSVCVNLKENACQQGNSSYSSTRNQEQ